MLQSFDKLQKCIARKSRKLVKVKVRTQIKGEGREYGNNLPVNTFRIAN